MPPLYKYLAWISLGLIVVLFVMVFRINTHGKDLTQWAGDVTKSAIVLGPDTHDRATYPFRLWADSLWITVHNQGHNIAALQSAQPNFHLPPPPPPPDW